VDDDVNIDGAVEKIISIKSVSPEVHPQFVPILRMCLLQICGYRQLITEVDSVRKIKYSSENPDHEKMLLTLWEKLMPGVLLESRINKQWTEIGFQGDDPMTDFRGMGLLGLENLLFFVTQYNDAARQLLSHSHHPKYGYSLAIVGINITGMAFQLLTGGHLKSHFYNTVKGRPKLEHFHQVYCYLMYEFDRYWMAEKTNIMEFNIVKARFQKKIAQKLRNKSAVLHRRFVS